MWSDGTMEHRVLRPFYIVDCLVEYPPFFFLALSV